MRFQKKFLSRILVFFLAAAFQAAFLIGCTSPAKAGNEAAITPTDYSDPAHWYMLPEAEKAVDTFFIYPTLYDEEDGNDYAALDEEQVLSKIDGMYEGQASVFADSTNVFIPFYRQANMNIEAEAGEAGDMTTCLMSYPRTDIFAALDYYFENYNDGRPFIIAGHSQGAALTKIALKEYFKDHPDYYERMVAAYVIGFSVTEKELSENPHLKFAEGADDVGVIVSWNTEGEGNKDAYNLVVQKGGISINPLNWKRDETPAGAEENLGSYLQNDDTGEYEICDVGADATVDTERGVVISHADYDYIGLTDIFGPASYHNGDYSLFYENLKENVALRTEKALK